MAKANKLVAVLAAAALACGFLAGGMPTAHAAPTLATYSFTSPGWATFGIALPQGEATGAVQVGSLPTQTDVKNAWPDGSIRYAIVTTHVATVGAYDITEGSAPTGTFTPVIPQARLTLTAETAGLGSTVLPYVSDLPNTVSSDLWLSGPLVKEWRVRTAPKNAGVDHPFLTNIWDVRAYNDGTSTVDVTVENVRDVAEADGVVYGVNITVDGVSAYTHDAARPGTGTLSGDNLNYTVDTADLVLGNFIRLTSGPSAGQVVLVTGIDPAGGSIATYPTEFSPLAQTNATWETVLYHQYGSRWHKLIPARGFLAADVVTDFAPFVAAGAVPDYLPTVSSAPESPVETGQWQPFDLMGYGIIMPFTYAAGARPELYLCPEWAARFVAHGTPELKTETLAYGDISGNYCDDFATSDPSKVVTVDDNPDYWLDPALLISGGGSRVAGV